MADAVRCVALIKRFGRRTVLAGLDLSVRPGEVFGLVGGNGGSKTTVLRLIAGLLKPDTGACYVFGRPPDAMRQHIGYMAQRLSLYANLTVLENLQAQAGLFRLAHPRDAARATIERFELQPYAATQVAHLSGGWARRVQFGAALIHTPRIVLLDEPTVGMDAPARQQVWAHIFAIADQGATVIVSTHDLQEAERFSRLVFLAGGQVVAAGTPAEVVAAADVRSFLICGSDALAAASSFPQQDGVIAAYPSMGTLRVVTCAKSEVQAIALARRLGTHAATVPTSLHDAALALLHPRARCA
jgi:ABC-2 type transport system ATP-binding protein